jgi:hypothetical protein
MKEVAAVGACKTARTHKTECRVNPGIVDRVIVGQIQKLDFKWEN